MRFLSLITLLAALSLVAPAYAQPGATPSATAPLSASRFVRTTPAPPAAAAPAATPSDAPDTTATADVVTPRTPRYPRASRGWNVPLGQRDRKPGVVINRFIIHHTTNTGDESPYFKRRNERSSCPTWYVTSTGEVIEFIDPVKRPSSTGAANDYSVAVETQNTSRAPDWGISQASHESLAHIAAWLSQQTHLGPYKVDIKLDRTHIIGHNEAGVNKTVCPGPSMRMDWIVQRAQEIAAETAPKP